LTLTFDFAPDDPVVVPGSCSPREKLIFMYLGWGDDSSGEPAVIDDSDEPFPWP
jgi:hypothetical protein